MTEQQDLIASLEEADVLNAIRWAYASATARTLTDYSPTAGHNTTWLGITQHVLFADRLDRVFSSGDYLLAADVIDTVGLDLVRAQLTAEDIATMPKIAAGSVIRADLNNSPGWAAQGIRFLLQSSPVDKIDTLPWPQKRPTKRKVARQRNPEPDLGLLAGLPESAFLEAFAALASQTEDLGMKTFVVAHALDGLTGRSQLKFGRPHFNTGGGPAWVWLENLLTTPLPPASRADGPMPPTGPDDVPDAPVTLRRGSAKKPKASEQ